jgi:capsular polysaccharide export protein
VVLFENNGVLPAEKKLGDGPGEAEETAHFVSKYLNDLQNANAFLGDCRLRWAPQPYRLLLRRYRRRDFFVGWGYKKGSLGARRVASFKKLPFIYAEDGLLRSVGLGVLRDPPLSMAIDDLAPYYDARGETRLEAILAGRPLPLPSLPPFAALRQRAAAYGPEPLCNPSLLSRAGSVLAMVVENRLSKFNNAPTIRLPSTDRRRVLVVDQTFGDASISTGLANADSFRQLLELALTENPTAEVVVKIHPDVMAGKKRGHLVDANAHPRVRLLTVPCNPIGLIEQVEHVYVVTSQLGMEALMVGKRVTCAGIPFYAGWGLTRDLQTTDRRLRKLSVEQLFAGAYMLYTNYALPGESRQTDIESICRYLIRNSGGVAMRTETISW